MKTKFCLYIIAFVALMASNPLFSQSQVRTTSLVYEAKNVYTLYRESMIDTSIVRDWAAAGCQLMYVRYDIGKCNSSIGLFRILPVTYCNGDLPEEGKEYPVDFYVTDIKIIGRLAFFCGSLFNGDWLFGTLWRNSDNGNIEIKIYTGDEKWYHPQKIDVACDATSTIHIYSVGYYGYVQTSDVGGEYYAQSGLDNGKGPSIILAAKSKGTFASELLVDSGNNGVQPMIRFARSTDGLVIPFLDGDETMSYEDVVVANNKVVFLGHFTDGSDADVALEHYPRKNGRVFSLLSAERERIRIESFEDHNTGQLFCYYNKYNKDWPLSKVCGAFCNDFSRSTNEDIIVFATKIRAVCDPGGSEKQLIGLDMIRIMNNDGSVERLGQTAIRKELSNLVDIKANYHRFVRCKVAGDNNMTIYDDTLWFSEVAVLIDVLGTDNNYHSEIVTFHDLRGYQKYLDERPEFLTHTVSIFNNNIHDWDGVTLFNSIGVSINRPAGMLYNLENYPRFTSLDVFNGNINNSSAPNNYLCASSVGVYEPQFPVDVFQKKIVEVDSVPNNPCNTYSLCEIPEVMIRCKKKNVNSDCWHFDLCAGHSGSVISGVTKEEYAPLGTRLENVNRPNFVFKSGKYALKQICAECSGEGSTGQGKGQRPRDAETSFEERVVISPNPSHELIRVTSNTELKRIEVFDINGVNVMNQDCGTKSAVIRLDKLTSGIYFMRIIDDTGVVTKAFSKE